MQVNYSKKFLKSYRRLSVENQKLVDSTLELFLIDNYHPKLRNHLLSGALAGIRAIKVGYDLRILYTEIE